MKSQITRTLGLALCAASLALISSTASAVVLRGNPYVPTGANFQIVGLQGIDAAHPLGQSGLQTQVNTDFEFTPSIGVSYDTGNGTLKDFGLGLYQNAAHGLESTGLRTNYNAPVLASSVTITVEDFDINSSATGFNLSGKVAPTITLLGANNSVFATFGQADIFKALVADTTHVGHDGKPISDVWDISFADLLSSLHLADGQITGFLLAADMANGEKASDPYLLLSVGNGIMVPEPANYAVGVAAILFGALFHRRQIRLQRAARV
jgi:hypothetical protein